MIIHTFRLMSTPYVVHVAANLHKGGSACLTLEIKDAAESIAAVLSVQYPAVLPSMFVQKAPYIHFVHDMAITANPRSCKMVVSGLTKKQLAAKNSRHESAQTVWWADYNERIDAILARMQAY